MVNVKEEHMLDKYILLNVLSSERKYIIIIIIIITVILIVNIGIIF